MSAFQPLHPKIVLGVAAHPDDLDASMGGSIAAWIDDGAEVYYLVLTDGCKGTADIRQDSSELIQIRRQEQREAAARLGVADVFFGDYEDGTLEASLDVKRDIARTIRQVRPDVVLAMDPTVLYDADRGFINHADHRAAGLATVDAVYPMARDHLSCPELFQQERLEPHKTPTLLLVNPREQNFYVDITNYMDKKLSAMAAHVSQGHHLEPIQGAIRDWALAVGKQAGVQYAEGYIRIDIDT